MSARRCPNCGGLVGADAEWCTQCFARLDDIKPVEPAAQEQQGEWELGTDPDGAVGIASAPVRAPTAPSSGEAGPVKVVGEAIVWDCAACGTQNPIEARICSVCGTPFGQMFEEPEVKPEVDPGRAAMFSLFFPGAGHYVAGHRGDGFARAVIFAFALIMGIASIGPVRAGSGGTYLLLMIVSLGAAAALYVVSTADAGRAARGDPQILSTRMLLYGAIGLIFTAIALLTFAVTQARG